MFYEIHTDGSCFQYTNDGGWAYIVLVEGQEMFRDSGHIRTAHPGRCEAEAVAQALSVLPNPSLGATVYCDVPAANIRQHVEIPDWVTFRGLVRGRHHPFHSACHRMSRAAAKSRRAKKEEVKSFPAATMAPG